LLAHGAQLFGAEPALVHAADGHGVQQHLHGVATVAAQFQALGGIAQRQQQALLGLDLGLDLLDLGLQHTGQWLGCLAVQQRHDGLQRQAGVAQGQHAVQAQHVGLAIAAVAGFAAARGAQQAEFFVMVQGAHREAGALGQLSHRVIHVRSRSRETGRMMKPHVT